jgi:hypothetical protein
MGCSSLIVVGRSIGLAIGGHALSKADCFGRLLHDTSRIFLSLDLENSHLKASQFRSLSSNSRFKRRGNIITARIRRQAVKMAELGVISGSLGMVSLAIQVAESVKKVKGFLDSVKEAPEEIRYILRQIEALGLVLSNCDTEEDERLVSEAVSASIETSKTFLIRAGEALEMAVKDLEIEIRKGKKMGSFKAVLKQGIIDRLRQRLRDAQDLLVLSNQYYSQ